jgi:hypothetical protein
VPIFYQNEYWEIWGHRLWSLQDNGFKSTQDELNKFSAESIEYQKRIDLIYFEAFCFPCKRSNHFHKGRNYRCGFGLLVQVIPEKPETLTTLFCVDATVFMKRYVW